MWAKCCDRNCDAAPRSCGLNAVTATVMVRGARHVGHGVVAAELVVEGLEDDVVPALHKVATLTSRRK